MDNLILKTKSLAFNCLFYLKHPTQVYSHFKIRSNLSRISSRQLVDIKNENPKVSIIIITYGAFDYIKKCLTSLSKFRPNNCEIIVYDNGSEQSVKEYLSDQLDSRTIDKLKFSEKNHYFIKGNNEASKLASPDSDFFLLLNSDVEIFHKDWLKILLTIHPGKGISSLGTVFLPVPRPDGWCFLVDKKTFRELGGLNEYFQMNWGITDFTARVLAKGFEVNTVFNPEKLIIHYGSKSYLKKSPSSSNSFNFLSETKVIKLFKGLSVKVYNYQND